MIRPLRRAHPIVVSLIAAISVAGTIAAGIGRVSNPPAPVPALLREPVFPEAVYSARAWLVDGDTLYLELARSSADTIGVFARFTASRGARWPDAVVLWSRDQTGRLSRDATALGIVAADRPLVARLPRAIGSIHLYSTPWNRLLGSWPLASPSLAVGPGR
ncbi:MAG TPA: hypothetical protein VGA42_01370 [Gemmatimonadales bacterium]